MCDYKILIKNFTISKIKGYIYITQHIVIYFFSNSSCASSPSSSRRDGQVRSLQQRAQVDRQWHQPRPQEKGESKRTKYASQPSQEEQRVSGRSWHLVSDALEGRGRGRGQLQAQKLQSHQQRWVKQTLNKSLNKSDSFFRFSWFSLKLVISNLTL